MLKELNTALAALDLSAADAEISAAQARVDEIEAKRRELNAEKMERIHKAQRIELDDRNEAEEAARRALAGESLAFPSAAELRAQARQIDATLAALGRIADEARPAVREARQSRDQIIADAVKPTVDELREALQEPFDLLREAYAGLVVLSGATGSGAAGQLARKLGRVLANAGGERLTSAGPIRPSEALVTVLRKHSDKLPGRPRPEIEFPRDSNVEEIAGAYSAGMQAGLVQAARAAR